MDQLNYAELENEVDGQLSDIATIIERTDDAIKKDIARKGIPPEPEVKIEAVEDWKTKLRRDGGWAAAIVLAGVGLWSWTKGK